MTDQRDQNPCTNYVQTPPVDLTPDEVNLYKSLVYLRNQPNVTLRKIQERVFPNASIPTISRASEGIMPKRDEPRVALNLPPLRPAPVCPECGELHVIGECTQGKVVTVKPRRNGKPRRRQPPNVYIGYATDEERAAIMALTPDERKRRLLDAGP